MSEANKKYQINITKSDGKRSVGDFSSRTSSTTSRNKKVDPSKYKNFDKVYKSYADTVYKKPWHRFQFQQSKNRKTTLYIMVIIVVLALVIKEFLTE